MVTRRLAPALAALALLLAAGVARAAHPGGRVWTFDEVATYLTAASGGLVRPTPGVDHTALAYVRSPAPPDRFLPAEPRDPRLDQDAWRFDVDGFVARESAPDFVEAKRRYYRSLAWLDGEQAHAQAYARPDAWKTLNHPPQKSLDGPRERWTHLFAGSAPDADPGYSTPFFDPAFQVDIDVATGTGLSHGNTVHLLANGAAFPEKMRLVQSARRRLYVAVMFWACDDTADALADAMAERVRAGVDVRVITEGLYRETITRRCIDRLEAGGVRVVEQGDALRPRTFGAVLHWKLWIRDGEEMVIGGQNNGNYENRSDGFNFLDRDTDLLARGPVVVDAERAWIAAWRAYGKGLPDDLAAVAAEDEGRAAAERTARLRGAENYADWLGDPATRMAGNCRVLMQGVNARTQPIGPVVETYVAASREQVVFSSPTVRYDHHAPENEGYEHLCVHQLMTLLHDRAASGPHVVVLTNGIGGGIGESTTWLTHRKEGAWRARQLFLYRVAAQFTELVARRASVATRTVTVPLAENHNVEVWTYFQYIHSKIWLFDRVAALVGSWNLELNSTDKNPEAAVICLDAGLRDEVEDDLTLALVNAVPDASAAVLP